MMLFASCGNETVSAPSEPGTSAVSETSDDTGSVAEALSADVTDPAEEDVTDAVSGDVTGADTGAPSVHEDYPAGVTSAEPRGETAVEIVEDPAAAGGKALKISGRSEAWNGANYSADVFRGNTVRVKGSFRSSNAAVRVSIQFDVYGNTSYNMVFSVGTNGDSYTSGGGEYTIPESAENIYIYIESDNLDDIYTDSFSIDVVGEYTYHEKAAGLEFADTSEYPSLKEVYADYFRIGTAFSGNMVSKPEYSGLIASQFSSVTAENDMKPEAILQHIETVADKEKYMECPALDFEHLRPELDFARDNGMTVRGHTLVWHSQTPDWFFYKDYSTSGELADRELMLSRMENYIRSYMEWTNENYPGLISAWDVVNEAIDDGGGIRKSLWYQTIGDDYIRKAFEYARKYAPEGTKLFYNDYNSYQPGKQYDIIQYLKPIAEDGNIDGVGMQSHISTQNNLLVYMTALKKYHDELGVEIQITELDVGADKNDGWEERQAAFYGDLFGRLIKAKQEGVPITSVTFWGVSDGNSWRASDMPLVLRADLSRKPAFDAVIAAANDAEAS